jgi:hypothetical protein
MTSGWSCMLPCKSVRRVWRAGRLAASGNIWTHYVGEGQGGLLVRAVRNRAGLRVHRADAAGDQQVPHHRGLGDRRAVPQARYLDRSTCHLLIPSGSRLPAPAAPGLRAGQFHRHHRSARAGPQPGVP